METLDNGVNDTEMPKQLGEETPRAPGESSKRKRGPKLKTLKDAARLSAQMVRDFKHAMDGKVMTDANWRTFAQLMDVHRKNERSAVEAEVLSGRISVLESRVSRMEGRVENAPLTITARS